MTRKVWLQGRFRPTRPDKYIGKNADHIVYRSSWELALMNFLDNTEEILKWSSETVIIPYLDQSKIDEFGNPKQRKYYVDFIALVLQANGVKKVTLIEVKPKNQIDRPKKTSRMADKTYQEAVNTWITNQCKWDAAKRFCELKGWEFIILNEEHIFPNFKKLKRIRPKRAKKSKPAK